MAVDLRIPITAEAETRKGFRTAEKQVDLFGRNVTASFGKIGAGLGVAFGLREIGQAAISAFNDIDKAQKLLVRETGATGDALKRLQSDTRTVFTGVPESMTEVAGAVSQVSRLFNISGAELRSLTNLTLDFGRVTGTDGVRSVNRIAGAMRLFGVEASQADEVMGDIVRASQRFAVASEDVITGLEGYAGSFAGLGFNLEESIGLMAQFQRAGVPIQKIGEGLAQFIPNVLKSGRDVRSEFTRWIDLFSQGEEGVFDFTEAVKFFGAESINALIEAAPHLDLTDTLGKNVGLVGQLADDSLTVADRFAIVGNQVQAALIPVFEDLVPLLEGMAEVAGEFVQTWQEQGLGSALSGVLLPTLKDIAAAIFNAEGAAGLLVDALLLVGGVKVILGISNVIGQIAALRAAQAGAAAAMAGQGGMLAALAGVNPLVAGIGAAALAGILTVKYWDEITDAVEGFAEALGGALQDIGVLPDRVTVSAPDVHDPSVAGGRFGGTIRAQREAQEAEEAAATALRAAATSLIDLQLFNQGQITATATARQQEARQAEEAADALRQFEQAVQLSRQALLDELALRNLADPLTPVGQLEAFLNQDEFAKTEEGFKQFREGLAQASDAAMTTFEGFQTVELARLQALLAGIDPAEEGAAAAVAAVQAEIDGLFDRWLVDLFGPDAARIIAAVNGVTNAVNKLEVVQLVGGALTGFGPGATGDGGRTTETETELEAQRRRRAEEQQRLRVDAQAWADSVASSIASQPGGPGFSLGNLLPSGGGPGPEGTARTLTNLFGGGSEARRVAQALTGTGPNQGRFLPGGGFGGGGGLDGGATTGREAQTNRALRVLSGESVGSAGAGAARAVGLGGTQFGALGGSPAAAAQFARAVGLSPEGFRGLAAGAGGGSLAAALLGGRGGGGGIGGLGATVGPNISLASAILQGAAVSGDAIQQVAAAAAAADGGTASQIAQALGIGGGGVGGNIGNALGILGGLGGVGMSGLNPAGALLEGVGEAGRSFADVAGTVAAIATGAGLAGTLGAAAAGAGLAGYLGISSAAAGTALATGGVSAALGGGAAVGTGTLLGISALAAAPIVGLGALGAITGYGIYSGFAHGLNISEADIHDPSRFGGRFRSLRQTPDLAGTTVNNYYPAGTDPGQITGGNTRASQLGFQQQAGRFRR